MYAMQMGDIIKAIGVSSQLTGTVEEISTDSRTIKPGSVFLAIQGENFDGHNYISSALEKGAICAIADKKIPLESDRILYVENTKQALLEIGKAYKKQFSVKVIGVTGSVGKTTTKDFIACVVASKYRTLKSLGNQNNEIGVPQTLFNLTNEHEVCVLELGMSGFGEIAQLAQTVEPDIGVITNIGVCHLEYLKTRENILKAKLEISVGMSDDAPLILCGDNDLLSQVKLPNRRVIFYGMDNPKCDFYATDIVETGESTSFCLHYNRDTRMVVIPAIGHHNVQNALAALAVGQEMNIPMSQAITALGEYIPSGMRQRIVSKQGITFVEDCYNASPDSVKAAMKTFGSFPTKGKRVAVLGDMLELGSLSKEAHIQVGDILKQYKIPYLLVYGEQSRQTAERASELGIDTMWFESKEKLVDELLSVIEEGDTVWLKASRGMMFEEILKNVYSHLEQGK